MQGDTDGCRGSQGGQKEDENQAGALEKQCAEGSFFGRKLPCQGVFVPGKSHHTQYIARQLARAAPIQTAKVCNDCSHLSLLYGSKFCRTDELVERFAPDDDCAVVANIDAWRHLNDEAAERLHVPHADRHVLDHEKGLLCVDETWSQIELVVWTGGETSNVRDLVARDANFAFAPMKQTAPFEVAHQVPYIERFRTKILKCCCVRRSRRCEDRQRIDAYRKTDGKHREMSGSQDEPTH